MKNGRNTAGQFSAGNSGRTKGSRNKARIAIESLLQGQAEALTQTAVTRALEGDSVALRLCMERVAPVPKDQPVSFSLPTMNNALDASEAAGSLRQPRSCTHQSVRHNLAWSLQPFRINGVSD